MPRKSLTSEGVPVDENDLSGSHAADMLGVDHGSVFKDPCTEGEKRTGFFVCCIPVDGEVDLKKAAKAGEIRRWRCFR